MMAAEGGRQECLSILLAHGAEVDETNAVSVRGVCNIANLLWHWHFCSWHVSN